MSLIKCPECEKEISDSVNQCVHCGYILKKKSKEDTKVNNKGKVIIHGYKETFVVNPAVKIYDNDKYIGEVGKGQTISLPIEKDTTLKFKSSIRSTEVNVYGNTLTEIQLSFNRGTGVLKAITNIQSNDVESNRINASSYNSSIDKEKNNNFVWLIVGIICLILGLLMFL